MTADERVVLNALRDRIARTDGSEVAALEVVVARMRQSKVLRNCDAEEILDAVRTGQAIARREVAEVADAED